MINFRALPRYLVVGAVMAVISNIILIGFDKLHIHYVVSCLTAFVVTLVLAYGLHTHWTFGASRSFMGLLRYGAAMSMNVPVSMALFFLLISVLGVPMIFAAPLTTVLLTAINYVVTYLLMAVSKSS